MDFLELHQENRGASTFFQTNCLCGPPAVCFSILLLRDYLSKLATPTIVLSRRKRRALNLISVICQTVIIVSNW